MTAKHICECPAAVEAKLVVWQTKPPWGIVGFCNINEFNDMPHYSPMRSRIFRLGVHIEHVFMPECRSW